MWDRLEGDFVERIVDDERTASAVLGVQLFVAPVTVVQDGIEYPAALRAARDPDLRDLVPTREEARRDAERARRDAEQARRDAEQGRRDAEQARRSEEGARKEAEAHVAALEAEIARLRGR